MAWEFCRVPLQTSLVQWRSRGAQLQSETATHDRTGSKFIKKEVELVRTHMEKFDLPHSQRCLSLHNTAIPLYKI